MTTTYYRNNCLNYITDDLIKESITFLKSPKISKKIKYDDLKKSDLVIGTMIYAEENLFHESSILVVKTDVPNGYNIHKIKMLLKRISTLKISYWGETPIWLFRSLVGAENLHVLTNQEYIKHVLVPCQNPTTAYLAMKDKYQWQLDIQILFIALVHQNSQNRHLLISFIPLPILLYLLVEKETRPKLLQHIDSVMKKKRIQNEIEFT